MPTRESCPGVDRTQARRALRQTPFVDTKRRNPATVSVRPGTRFRHWRALTGALLAALKWRSETFPYFSGVLRRPVRPNANHEHRRASGSRRATNRSQHRRHFRGRSQDHRRPVRTIHQGAPSAIPGSGPRPRSARFCQESRRVIRTFHRSPPAWARQGSRNQSAIGLSARQHAGAGDVPEPSTDDHGPRCPRRPANRN